MAAKCFLDPLCPPCFFLLGLTSVNIILLLICHLPLFSVPNTQNHSGCWRDPALFPCGSTCKEWACHVGDLGSIPGLGRSPGEGKGYPLQCSGLENSMRSQRLRHDWVTLTSTSLNGPSVDADSKNSAFCRPLPKEFCIRVSWPC